MRLLPPLRLIGDHLICKGGSFGNTVAMGKMRGGIQLLLMEESVEVVLLCRVFREPGMTSMTFPKLLISSTRLWHGVLFVWGAFGILCRKPQLLTLIEAWITMCFSTKLYCRLVKYLCHPQSEQQKFQPTISRPWTDK